MVGTEEGPIAYYESKKSKWKAKSTHSVFKIIDVKKKLYGKDVNNEQSYAHNVIVVRRNGAMELRDWKKGNLSQVSFQEKQ